MGGKVDRYLKKKSMPDLFKTNKVFGNAKDSPHVYFGQGQQQDDENFEFSQNYCQGSACWLWAINGWRNNV